MRLAALSHREGWPHLKRPGWCTPCGPSMGKGACARAVETLGVFHHEQLGLEISGRHLI